MMSPPASVVAVAAAAVVAAALLGAANAVENGDESVFDDAIHAHDPRAVLNEGACLHMLCDGDDAHANAHANAAMAQPGSNRSASFASSSFIKRQGKHLVEEGSGQPFHIAGTNSYYLLEHASESEPWLKRSIVDETYAHANALGLNVVRTWAFYDGEGKFQMRPGVYNETFFDALDWVIARAEAHGLRLILSLTNFWDAYGGMQEYVRWAAEANGTSDGSLDGLDIRDFYRSEAMRQMYKDNFVALANRTNAYTGRRYKDDPTILAWELANEPRCPGDESGDVLQSWIQEMSRFVKDVAPKQLVTTGSEGFFGMSTPQLMHLNGNATFDFIEYLPMLCTGVDFVRNHDNTTAIDIPSFHLYPDHHAEELCHRGAPASDCAMQWTHAQTKVRVDLADDVLGKPLFIGEFGKMKHPLMEGTLDAQVVYRNRLFVEVYRQLEEAAIEGKASGGSTFWMLSAPAYKDYDNFTVYVGGNGPSLPEPWRPDHTVGAQRDLRGFGDEKACVARILERHPDWIDHRWFTPGKDADAWPGSLPSFNLTTERGVGAEANADVGIDADVLAMPESWYLDRSTADVIRTHASNLDIVGSELQTHAWYG